MKSHRIGLILLFIFFASCSPKKMFAPRVYFQVPDGLDCFVYLVYDPDQTQNPGVELDKVNGKNTYKFNMNGVILLKSYEAALLKDTWIKAINENGDELYMTKSGSRGNYGIFINSFIISKTKEGIVDCFHKKGIQDYFEILKDKGVYFKK